jgi:leucyl aminopeptidase (aminopeptidase T)
MVEGLGVQPGELIQVRDDAGRPDLLLELLLSIELLGATPLPQILSAVYMERLWSAAPRDYLENWDRHRRDWVEQTDRVLVLWGAHPDLNGLPVGAFQAWQRAVHRMSVLEEELRLPFLLVAIPTERRARQLGLSLDALEEILLPALGAGVGELQREIERVLEAVTGGQHMTIRSGDGHTLHLALGDRAWLSDDGHIDAEDRARGAIVSNLPAGSIYTTVLESETQGSLWLPCADQATDAVFHFHGGRIVEIEAASGADALNEMLDDHSGEPRRVSHIGVGLNPYLQRPIGWTVVDEHMQGDIFISLGENRYMGGQNESSLNVDYALPGATLAVDDRVVVLEGKLNVDVD